MHVSVPVHTRMCMCEGVVGAVAGVVMCGEERAGEGTGALLADTVPGTVPTW